MKNLLFCLALLPFSAAPAKAEQGCIDSSSVTITASICAQFDCVQRSGDKCTNWACTRTQASRYLDTFASGCTRVANCGRSAFFVGGDPQVADTDSVEQCDWYPCVEADPATGVCLSYLCVSKRVTTVVRTIYPDARCVPMPPGLAPPPEAKKAAPEKGRPAAPKRLQPKPAEAFGK